MMCDRILEYYLESECFDIALKEIYDSFSGSCIKDGLLFPFETDVTMKISKKISNKSDYYTILKSYHVENYFSKDYDDLQLSAIIWSILLEFQKNEVSLIADKRYSSYSLKILEMLLCGIALTEIKEIISNHKQRNDFQYLQMQYYIFDVNTKKSEVKDSKYIQAKYSSEHNCLIDDLGNKYTFDY